MSTVDVRKLTWDARYPKRHAEELSARLISSWANRCRDKRVLSFPAAEWIWENNFSNLYPFGSVVFEGLERDEHIYRKMVRASNRASMRRGHRLLSVRNEDLSVFVKRPRHPHDRYDMMYLDWMGTWAEDKLAQLHGIFSRGMLTRDSVLMFTLALNRGQTYKWRGIEGDVSSSLRVLDLRGGGSPISRWRTHGVPAMIEKEGRAAGYRVKALSVCVYHTYSNGHTSPQGLYTLICK